MARAGDAVQRPSLDIPLDTQDPSRLLWKDGILLRNEIPILKHGIRVGRVATEAHITELKDLFAPLRELGKTGELAVCAPLAPGKKYMQCFPSTLSPHVFTQQPRNVNGVTLPMSYALNGRTGVLITKDYRHQQVVAAYRPLKDLGLGMVLKVDTGELYYPIWKQIPTVVGLLVLVLAAGVLSLYWLVVPVVRRVVQSEQETREANAKFRDSETYIRAVLDNVDEGIITVSDAGQIESFNTAAARMFGFGDNGLSGRNVSTLMPGHEFATQGAGQDRTPGTGIEVAAIRNGGDRFPLGVHVSEMRLGNRRLLIGALRDLTAQKATEEEILRMATHDSLTGLPNRNLLQDRIQQAVTFAQRRSGKVVVMFIDLDNFKTINDSLGHDMGDALLQAVASRISGCLRDQDTVGRQGGDEFIVVLGEIHKQGEASAVAKKILRAVSEPYLLHKRELHINASIGIAIYPDDGGHANSLLKNSDTAMYFAKESGRNNYQFFSAQMNADAAERLALETSLRYAIEQDQIVLQYQPVIALADGRIVATEALARWHHPQLGQIPPMKFISIAEDSGLIVPLGEHVLRLACRQLQEWRAQGIELPRMIVNLSPRQLRHRDIAARFARILEETGLDPTCLGLEITETVIMEDPDRSIGILQELKGTGIELSLDDFGTGYSSLSYLKRFPIDVLKIDQSFIRDITEDSDDASLVAAIIAMAHNIGVRVVAEGVETAQQLEFIRRHGCDEYQGYFHSRPSDADALLALLRAQV
ncbi:MAG: hypothetical protein B7Z66_15765 [Chromatiales bacterium 21-64-14]|nr:MAG: hypothetical protein B7Z66_15765 [Chromatiales bacterium 21-64-14]